MEDFVWIFVVLAVWLFEIAGKGLKKQQSSPRVETDALRAEPASRKERSRELDASARRAEDALQSWEAGQQEQRELAASPVRAATHRTVSKTQRRREALESIAGMLAAPADKTDRADTAPAMRQQAKAVPVRRAALAPRQLALVPPVVESPRPPVQPVRRSGIRQLAGLTEIQRAIVLSEIVGPPVSLQNRPAFHLDFD